MEASKELLEKLKAKKSEFNNRISNVSEIYEQALRNKFDQFYVNGVFDEEGYRNATQKAVNDKYVETETLKDRIDSLNVAIAECEKQLTIKTALSFLD